VLLWQFDWRYVLVIAVTVVLYMYFTYSRPNGASRSAAR
jgi:ABC-type transport system involved in Fe-S cluster assembly fused permease/ATPase subunit